MHDIIKQHGLYGEFRWLVAQKDPVRNGELYRCIAGEGTKRKAGYNIKVSSTFDCGNGSWEYLSSQQ